MRREIPIPGLPAPSLSMSDTANEFLQTPLPDPAQAQVASGRTPARVRAARPKTSARFAVLVISTIGILGIGLLHLKDQRLANIAAFRATAEARANAPGWVRQATPVINLRLPNGKDLQFSGPDVQAINSWYEPHPTQWYQGKAVVHARVGEEVHAELRYNIAVGQLVPVYAESRYVSAPDVAQRLAEMHPRRASDERKPSPVEAAKTTVKKLFTKAPPAAPASQSVGVVHAEEPVMPASAPAAPASAPVPVATRAPAPPPAPAPATTSRISTPPARPPAPPAAPAPPDDPIAAFAHDPAGAAARYADRSSRRHRSPGAKPTSLNRS